MPLIESPCVARAAQPMGEGPVRLESPSGAGIIDVAHLRRMTCGEKALEAEVLVLFKRQADQLLARMQQAPTQAGAAFAHTLAGSARGVGAWRVAAAAEAVELAARDEDGGAIAGALRRLELAVHEARAAIGAMLSPPTDPASGACAGEPL